MLPSCHNTYASGNIHATHLSCSVDACAGAAVAAQAVHRSTESPSGQQPVAKHAPSGFLYTIGWFRAPYARLMARCQCSRRVSSASNASLTASGDLGRHKVVYRRAASCVLRTCSDSRDLATPYPPYTRRVTIEREAEEAILSRRGRSHIVRCCLAHAKMNAR